MFESKARTKPAYGTPLLQRGATSHPSVSGGNRNEAMRASPTGRERSSLTRRSYMTPCGSLPSHIHSYTEDSPKRILQPVNAKNARFQRVAAELFGNCWHD